MERFQYDQFEAQNVCHALFPALQWRAEDGYLTAHANEGFRELYKANETSMVEVGFTMHEVHDPHYWIVRFHYNVPRRETSVLWAVLTARVEAFGVRAPLRPRDGRSIEKALQQIRDAATELEGLVGAHGTAHDVSRVNKILGYTEAVALVVEALS